jgi:acetyl esterase/lipase
VGIWRSYSPLELRVTPASSSQNSWGWLPCRPLPPLRIHVGEDEVLLDDSRRYIERAVASGVDAHLDVWQCLAHGFAASVGKLKAATHALDALGAFLANRLQATP